MIEPRLGNKPTYPNVDYVLVQCSLVKYRSARNVERWTLNGQYYNSSPDSAVPKSKPERNYLPYASCPAPNPHPLPDPDPDPDPTTTTTKKELPKQNSLPQLMILCVSDFYPRGGAPMAPLNGLEVAFWFLFFFLFPFTTSVY